MINGQLMPYGSVWDSVRHTANLLRAYKHLHNADTIADILSIYSPRTENRTDKLIYEMSQRMQIPANQHMDLRDDILLAKLVSAITQQEGLRYVSPFDVKVMITNNTGGSAAVTAAGAAVAP